jgi:hypothetical protein
MSLKFNHEFDDLSADGMLFTETDLVPPAKVKLEVDEEGGFWLTANREGFIHLARIFAELGLGNYENGYHFHLDENFEFSTGAPEFTFMVDNDPS